MKPAQIILIEDNPADVMLVKLALHEAGIAYELTHFETGVEAAERLCESDGGEALRPNAILLDLNTPRSDGFEVLGKLIRSPMLAGVPIAVFTSSRARVDRTRAQLQGARYIEKPSQLLDFFSTVARTVNEMLAEQASSGHQKQRGALDAVR